MRMNKRQVVNPLRETNLPLRTFPEDCPYLFDDIIADNFLCDTLQDWE